MLPIIDFSRFIDAASEKQQALAEDIGRTCETKGFFQLANHSVPRACTGLGKVGSVRLADQSWIEHFA